MKKTFYFRSEKNSYQQGEQISIIGKPIIQSGKNNEGYLHIYSNDSLINTKPLFLTHTKVTMKENFGLLSQES